MDISDNLGVYVICKNEENLIVPCVTSLMNVFPQVQVVDLGSKDATLDRLNNLGVQVTSRACTPSSYSALKNELASGHEWVFMVDGDEIYPEESLRRIPDLICSGEYHAYRISWKYLKVSSGDVYMNTAKVVNGPKIYRPARFKFIHEWPKEVLKGKPRMKEPKRDNGVWCWHGKLLNRSSVKADQVREQKRKDYPRFFEEFHGEPLDWIKLKDFPWSNSEEELWKEV